MNKKKILTIPFLAFVIALSLSSVLAQKSEMTKEQTINYLNDLLTKDREDYNRQFPRAQQPPHKQKFRDDGIYERNGDGYRILTRYSDIQKMTDSDDSVHDFISWCSIYFGGGQDRFDLIMSKINVLDFREKLEHLTHLIKNPSMGVKPSTKAVVKPKVVVPSSRPTSGIVVSDEKSKKAEAVKSKTAEAIREQKAKELLAAMRAKANAETGTAAEKAAANKRLKEAQIRCYGSAKGPATASKQYKVTCQ